MRGEGRRGGRGEGGGERGEGKEGRGKGGGKGREGERGWNQALLQQIPKLLK